MRQRAAVARALANQPTVLLMDEPFAAVDAMTRQRLQEELATIAEIERMTVIFVTHAIEEAIYLANRVIVLSGRPGTIKAELEIDLPRPRRWDQLLHDTRFASLRAELLAHVHGRAVSAAGAHL
jgi:ABC-type nitrate/sulfonate/bicarbonate transport system ATPase subunit